MENITVCALLRGVAKLAEELSGKSSAAERLSAMLQGFSPTDDETKELLAVSERLAAGGDAQKKSGNHLRSIFSGVSAAKKAAALEYDYLAGDLGSRFPSAHADDGANELEMLLERFADGLISTLSVGAGALCELLDDCFSFVASPYCENVSLAVHSKLTAAFAVCLSTAKGDKSSLKALGNENALLLCGADLSGIQDFIYTVSPQGAMRSLKGRSFYIEVLLTVIADELLSACGLTRANLLYTGGGNFYLLLPNTPHFAAVFDDCCRRANDFLLAEYGLDLYLAYASVPVSGVLLGNSQTLSECWRKLSRGISASKLSRYDTAILQRLFSEGCQPSGERECGTCRRSLHESGYHIGSTEVCRSCFSMYELGGALYRGLNCGEAVVFVSAPKHFSERPLCRMFSYEGEAWLSMLTMSDYQRKASVGSDRVRFVYAVNYAESFVADAFRLDVGSYAASMDGEPLDFDALADKSRGIRRLGVLRADVDNLGKMFSSGFGDRASLSRYCELSKALGGFFRESVNSIAAESCGSLLDNPNSNSALAVIYSGGDDLFVLGAWNEVLAFAARLNEAFARFCGGRLTISAGFGLFAPHYPVHEMARLTAKLESAAKDAGKKRLACFEATETDIFEWSVFIGDVCGDKLQSLNDWFSFAPDSLHINVGNSFLYRLLQLCRANEERINIARILYALARIEPQKCGEEIKLLYSRMCDRVCGWLQSAADVNRLAFALMLQIYLNRG